PQSIPRGPGADRLTKGGAVRIVFMGTPQFAVPSLRAIAARHEVALVVTRPDAVSGRGSSLVPSPVKTAALELELPVLEAASLRHEDVLHAIASRRPDAVCVVAYGALLPSEILRVPPLGCINAHASLLPRHRGAAPIERAILAGDEVTGVSIMRMEEGLDTGPVALRVSVEIGDDDAAALTLRLARVAADSLLATIDDEAAGRAVWVPQDASRASYAHKIARDDVRLDPALTAAEALRRIRASSERVTARIRLADSSDAVVVSARLWDGSVEPGTATLSPEGPILGLADGALLVTRLRPAGRRTLSGSDFVRGARLPDRFSWSSL
ncbi:MAG: methionyl-tRNA formyltransferase, partial [Coriobacteriia bacterium]|nr:methionyl-tRNA formyltransferase [Coriobacteriia bacterium]